MELSTGRWVSGNDFFGRTAELARLKSLVCGGNHVLLYGQRRMGKTSIARELGRQLEDDGWVMLFADIEAATSPEDVITELAAAARPIRPISNRFVSNMSRLLSENVEEVGASEFWVKIRAGLSGRWREHGDRLIETIAEHEAPVLLVIDELPIFLMQLQSESGGSAAVAEFLSWLRRAFQGIEGRSPVLVVSGSIGLAPFVGRLGIPDRINYFHRFRIGPWNRDDSVECFRLLAESSGLKTDEDVANEVYELLGIGIPYYVQSFLTHLLDFAAMRNLNGITANEVKEVYRTELLGAGGQGDLVHYETRLRNALDKDTYRIAAEILAEAATQDVFTQVARRCLEQVYSKLFTDVARHTDEALNVLEHDGYLERGEDGHRYPFRLLKSWWSARLRDHHVPLKDRTLAKVEAP